MHDTRLNNNLNFSQNKKDYSKFSLKNNFCWDFSLSNKSLTKDTASFSSSKKNIQLQQTNKLSFTGKVPAQPDIKAYLKDYADYMSVADMHNAILDSFVNPTAAREINVFENKHQKDRGQLLNEVSNSVVKKFDKLKNSDLIVIGATEPAKLNFLDAEKYTQVKDIYLNLLDRPETFNRISFDAEDHQLETVLSQDQIEEETKDFKHIVNDILPEILKTKTFILDDQANLNSILSDEVIQGLIIDKLYEEIAGNKADNDEQEYFEAAEEKLHEALHTLSDINNKFNITTVSRVPQHFYDPLGKEAGAPGEYYNNQYLGLRQEPKNFYEAKFLNNAAKGIADYDPDSTIIVTPKSAANDIVEKIKAMNKDYLFIEDWFYKYCLGDRKTKDEILKTLNKSTDNKYKEQFKSIAEELDGYLNNYIQVYDINRPENGKKLTEKVGDFGKINCMSEISKGYFLGIGEDAKDLIKMSVGIGLFVEFAEKLSEKTGIPAFEIVAHALAANLDSGASAGANYLHWKNEFGDKVAEENFEKTIRNIFLAFIAALPFSSLSVGDGLIRGTLNSFMYRNLSAIDAYSGVINSLSAYSDKLKELMQNGSKNPPPEIKDDPKKVEKWKSQETWKAFSAHSLNKGQTLGVGVSQPFAIGMVPLMLLLGPASRVPLITLAGTLECWTSSVYFLLDNQNWHNFSNKLKESMVKNGTAHITPEEYSELRQGLISKAGQKVAGTSAFSWLSQHNPLSSDNGTVNTIKNSKAGHIAHDVINFAPHYIALGLKKFFDNKYNNMSEEERENQHGHHH
ncbi:MAG: hypothetical protein A2287_11165 [Candidatus Melainabacteria bacterium RIFOXYA12_FULL_32_12]|nr:MAG: hypothetical protein A2255_00950 [Candidatus Melainabacteria bacterium RIFOXYA2_FULL_32_9]OGI29809.1 MAG: hypothetical protein A2287_11165 [Candidatus Melainabacteria bacterium RIFOXYA12_FULL_32_12]